MRRITFKIGIGILTFIIGIAGVAVWFFAPFSTVRTFNGSQLANIENAETSFDNEAMTTSNNPFTNSINQPVEGVFMKVIDTSSKKVTLELSNKTNKTIYLFYNPSQNGDEITEVFRYWFRCKEKGKKEIDYNGFTSHIMPSLDRLEKNASFRFEVKPLPKINAECKISLLYYDDPKIEDLINNKLPDLDKSEQKSVDKAKKSAEVEFRLTTHN